MSHQRIGCCFDANDMMHEQRGEDVYHVPVTTTEWLPNTMVMPRYPDFGYFFNGSNSVREGYHGDGYDKNASPWHTENVLVQKHHAQYEPVMEENLFAQRRHAQHGPAAENLFAQSRHAQHEPAAENVFAQRRHAQHEPVTEKVVAKKHHARHEAVNEGKQQTYREDVNMEADDFIKRKHRALDLSKVMSMKTFN